MSQNDALTAGTPLLHPRKTQAVSADGRPPAAASGPAANLQEQEPRVGGRRSEIGAQICQNYVSRAAARPEIIGATS